MSRGSVFGNTFLTERQYEILKLKKDNMAPQEIADKLGVTRQDISILERRVNDNIEKAMNTLNLAFELDFLHKIQLKKGMNILEASETVFTEADRLNVKLTESYLSIPMLIRSAASSAIKHGKLTRPLIAYLKKNGNITLAFDR